jgi:serine/threonine protein kinase
MEAADYGNLAAFISLSKDATIWNVQQSLLQDILSGLRTLHCNLVAHCDLKLDNILVFQITKKPGAIEYEAKLCDFGFSVIISDYQKGIRFFRKLGTEPWNAPELTVPTEIKIEQLPLADTYSFGLVAARIFMHGGSPFNGLTAEEIRNLKQQETVESLPVYEKVHSAIFSADIEYTEAQQARIRNILLGTLRQSPQDRSCLNALRRELTMVSVATLPRLT